MLKHAVLTALLGMLLMAPAAVNAEVDENYLNPVTFKQSMDGLMTKDEIIGVGAAAKTGNSVTVHYVGVLYPSMKKFDSSLERGKPFEFRLGAKQVIPGWEKGLLGMQPGGKRLLIIPPTLGYGPGGAGNAIPPNATLLFEVELLEVKEVAAPLVKRRFGKNRSI